MAKLPAAYVARALAKACLNVCNRAYDMAKNTLQRGHDAEGQVQSYLEKQGLTYITRNYKKSYGEIDLIMKDSQTLVFTEVRARLDFEEIHPFETIDDIKQAKIIAVAKQFLDEFADFNHTECRFDVVAVNLSSGKIEWLQNAFEGA